MLKKLCSFGFFLILMCNVFAQDISTQIPNLLPVSATAAHLIKVGLGSTKMPTGAATANFPLYELHEGGYTMPISLSYFSQGNKNEEQCTRAGFGWSLVAGGVITRKVKGVADELGTRLALPADLSAQAQDNLDGFEAIANTGNGNVINSGLDTQPDEFSFSFNGYSGIFYFDDSGVPVTMSHQNLKISVVSAGTYKIVTPDGTSYFFGGDNFDAALKPAGQYVKTAFYLNRILLQDGHNIYFNYQRILTNAISGFTEIIALNGPCEMATPTSINSHTWSYQATQNWSCILTSITTETQTVNFGYAYINDGSDDKRLTDISVINQNNRFIKQYHFSYLDVITDDNTQARAHVNDYPTSPLTSLAGKNGRFYLTHITQTYTVGVDGSQSIDYPIEYYGDILHENLSSLSNYAQDLHGFKNGKNNQTLFPLVGNAELTSSIVWADRSPDWQASITGMLKKISYPTGGKEEFFYEANTVSVTEPNTPDYEALDWTAHLGDQIPLHYLTVNQDQTVHVNLTHALSNPSNCEAGYQKMITVTIRDVTANTIINTATIYTGDNPLDYTFQALANHQYSFETYVFPAFQSCVFAYIHVAYYEYVPGTHTYNKEESGVRVKQIMQTDQFGNSQGKYFFYNSLADPQKSSGFTNLSDNVNGLFKSFKRNFLSFASDGVWHNYPCWDSLFVSNGIFNATTYEHSHIWYEHVIVSDDPLLNNGGTEYSFYNPPLQGGAYTRQGMPGVRPEDVTVAGFPDDIQKETIFDKNRAVVQVKENNYEYAPSPTHFALRSVYVKKLYTVYYEGTLSYGNNITPSQSLRDHLFAFDVAENFLTFNWPRLHDTKITQYDKYGHSFETTVAYNYGTQDNVFPASVSTTNSKQQPVITYKKYPTDFPADPVSAAMINANMITPLIDESTTRNSNGIETQHTKLIYADNGTPGGGFQPAKVQQKQTENASLEDNIIFSAYDNKGNLKEISKAGDAKISYLYDYHQSLVTAEVKNAVKGNIAFTSFEADDKGNFTYNGTPTADATAPTGGKVYNLSLGSVYFPATLDLSKQYIVSYWAITGSPKTVSGSSAMTTGRAVNGWTYYEHKINTMPSGGLISGNGVIDELRLYPADALMTTFTYEPLVGQTSQCDINNRITYYEYDGLQRLTIIRNQDKNIVKKICYNYLGQPQDCSGLFANTAHSADFTRNNCGAGGTGSTVTYTVPANVYTANTQAGADQLALNDIAANGQAYANTHGSCTNLFGNYAIGNSWVRNDCGPGMVGSQVFFSVAANTFYAATQTAADQQASTYLNANGQAHANANGTCTPYVCSSSNCPGPDHKCMNGVCETGLRKNLSSVRTKINGVFVYVCTYNYCFSDLSESASFTENNSDPCTVDLSCEN